MVSHNDASDFQGQIATFKSQTHNTSKTCGPIEALVLKETQGAG